MLIPLLVPILFGQPATPPPVPVVEARAGDEMALLTIDPE